MSLYRQAKSPAVGVGQELLNATSGLGADVKCSAKRRLDGSFNTVGCACVHREMALLHWDRGRFKFNMLRDTSCDWRTAGRVSHCGRRCA